MRRGVYRGVHSALLDDPDFQRLTARARLVLLTVRLCRDAGPAVIFRYYPEVLARQTGLSLAALETAMTELEQGNWIFREGAVVWVRNGLLHDPTIRLSSSKHREAVIRQLQGLPNVSLIASFCDYYEIDKAIVGLSKGHRGAIVGLSKGHRGAIVTETYSDTPKKTDTPSPNPSPNTTAVHSVNVVERAQPTREEQLRALARHNGLTPEELRAQAEALARETAKAMQARP